MPFLGNLFGENCGYYSQELMSNCISQHKRLILDKSLLSPVQVSVLHSASDVPVVAEYGVSGTTYAPEGTLFDNTADVQVVSSCPTHNIYFSFIFNCHWINFYWLTNDLTSSFGFSSSLKPNLLMSRININAFDPSIAYLGTSILLLSSRLLQFIHIFNHIQNSPSVKFSFHVIATPQFLVWLMIQPRRCTEAYFHLYSNHIRASSAISFFS